MKRLLALALALLLPGQAARADDFCATLRGAWTASQTRDLGTLAAGLGPGWSCTSPDRNGLACTVDGIDPAAARARFASLSGQVASCMGGVGLKRVDFLSSQEEVYFKRTPRQPMIGVAVVSPGLLTVMVIPED